MTRSDMHKFSLQGSDNDVMMHGIMRDCRCFVMLCHLQGPLVLLQACKCHASQSEELIGAWSELQCVCQYILRLLKLMLDEELLGLSTKLHHMQHSQVTASTPRNVLSIACDHACIGQPCRLHGNIPGQPGAQAAVSQHPARLRVGVSCGVGHQYLPGGPTPFSACLRFG